MLAYENLTFQAYLFKQLVHNEYYKEKKLISIP